MTERVKEKLKHEIWRLETEERIEIEKEKITIWIENERAWVTRKI